ncbi:kinesin-like protein KIF13B isoform X3 [Ostrea edulis]|uniref:kinesin-like protein KIF13B isoform X3 n=1 Tax=Ostrea edulis TaxID=37623 RepID=UPI0024AFB90C|nr:kinesin-like protein KIF13B isoform X3 [Ostrea edulis]
MSTEKVRVAVRVRPMNRREIEMSTKTVVDMEDNQTVLYHPSSPADGSVDRKTSRKQPKTFAFDNCFWSVDDTNPKFAGQEHVFNSVGKDLLEKAFEGYNGCIFAYGQTGSGKSYTMMGSLLSQAKGIIPRLCDLMFDRIAQLRSDDTSFKVEVSYMEIYNEKVHDLLDPKGSKQNLKVREHNILGPYVDGLSMLAVASFEDIDNLMNEGNKSRTVAATNMNNESSRSHAVFNIVLTQTLTDLSTGVSGEKVSKVSLVDLAGSERAQKTGAVGDRLREGSNINKSLTTLGLVISALADQSAASKKKDKFVPYRDSVLTWLLKDNLGGNSKTVMVATISPAADNYEETLSTLRYADRAKRIVNHAVVNEDPNARIIRDLRDEVDMLKQQLNEAQNMQAPTLVERLHVSEKLIKEMTKTWEEKLAEKDKINQERHETLEKMGVSVQTSGIKVEKGKCFLVNLNADPSLNELLVYYLKDHTLIGQQDVEVQQDIQLSGLGIMPEHCVVDIENGDVWLTPIEGARTCVNGSIIHEKTKVKNGDRILWGNNHFFRINCPKQNSPQSQPSELDQTIDYNFAQQELMMNEYSNDPIQEAICDLEKQYEEDKQVALEKQRQEYEQRMQMLRNQIMSPGTPSNPYLNFNSFTPTGTSSQNTLQRKYQKWAEKRKSNMMNSLQVLRGEVLKAKAFVREANVLSQEMGKKTEFNVTLQIPASCLSPNRRKGNGFVSEPAILVKRKNRPNQIWSMEKLENKIIDMREMYEELKSSGKPMMVDDNDSWEDGPFTKGDPFYESQENHNLIGVANIFLECLFHDVTLDYHVPIISQQGEIAGKLHIQISKLGGSCLERYGDTTEDIEETDPALSAGAPMIVRLTILSAKGLPSAMSNFVFCQYTFWGQEESVVVPPQVNPDMLDRQNSMGDTVTVKFQHRKDFKISITEEFIENCQDGALSVEVWGHRVTSTGNTETDIAKTVKAKSRSLVERWNEVMRKIELWTEIEELNYQGEWSAVEVQPKQDVPSAGVFQLQQGHSRRVKVRVRTVTESGILPLIPDTITSISIGGIANRSKMQKGLDSYQDDDLSGLRDRWSDALAKRTKYLNEQIQSLINKPDKTEADSDRERALLDQWVCLTEERNAVMVPAPGSGIPGAPADGESAPNMERHTPVLFLDLNADDMSTSSAREGYLAAGVNSILPKEHAGTFVNLPITKAEMDNGFIYAVASWDSTMHDSELLNRVTSSNDRIYLILKVVVRLSHPAYMELVLRKRMCINIYNSLSFTSLTGRLKQKITGTEKFFESGITYSLVSNIPKASEDLENMETLAQMAASQNDTSTADGESYIEKYLKGVQGVESILMVDRLRQEVAVKEQSSQKSRSLTKTYSVPNIHQSAMSPLQERQHNLRADSTQDLSYDPGRQGSPERPNFLNLRSIAISPPLAKSALSPLGAKGMKPLNTLREEQDLREKKPLLRGDTEEELEDEEMVENKMQSSKIETDPHSVESDDFQDFISYHPSEESHKAVTSDGIARSCTNDSLADVQCKNFTPSLVSSGYGSQAVSMLTLSSEDSLSIKSIEDNLESNKDSKGGQKGSLEQTSSDSDNDENKEVSNRLSASSDIETEEAQFQKEAVTSDNDSSVHVTENNGPEHDELKKSNVDSNETLDSSSSSLEARDGSLTEKQDPNDSNIHSTSCDTSLSELSDDVQKSSNTSVISQSERLKQSKEQRKRIVESLGAISNNTTTNKVTRDKRRPGEGASQRASAITEGVDPYSETAMEELEKLGFEENEYSEESPEKFPSEKTEELQIVETPGKPRQGKRNQQRPVSCIVSPSQDKMSVVEESMKRNSLTLHLSDDEMSGNDDSVSVCSFGSRADLDRLQEVPVPSWVQIGESVMVQPSKGSKKTGVVQFVGNVEFAAGPWVGVELDLPEGKNDGSVNGTKYFKCRSRHGIFVRHDKLILDKKRRGSRKQAKDLAKRHSMGNPAHMGTSPNTRLPSNQSSSPNSTLLKATTASSAKKK